MEQTRAAVTAEATAKGGRRAGYRYLDLITALFVADEGKPPSQIVNLKSSP